MEIANFRLKLDGSLAERHEFEGYDGYTSLAGAAWTLSLVTNYVETGIIRHRGDFLGRRVVRAHPIAPGSVLADFSVLLNSQPDLIFGIGATSATGLLYGLVHRVLTRNLGTTDSVLNKSTAQLLERKDGDIEALAAIAEPSIRQAHEVIGNGAETIDWIGGHSAMAYLDRDTKAWVKSSIPDPQVIEREVTVSGFYANSGHGSVFDFTLGRNVPFSLSKERLRIYGPLFSWALHQYTSKSGRKIVIRFTRMLAMDGRAKRYVIVSAQQANA